MYTHGSYTTSSWSFQYSVGDNAKHPTMDVLVEDDEDRIIAAWVEGQGKMSNIVVSSTNALYGRRASSASSPLVSQHSALPFATKVSTSTMMKSIFTVLSIVWVWLRTPTAKPSKACRTCSKKLPVWHRCDGRRHHHLLHHPNWYTEFE